MWGIQQQGTWRSLPNPFALDRPEVIAGRVSCRKTEINDIINGEQGALILAGTTNIGKSPLIRYLQLPPDAPWSWRDELASQGRQKLDALRFAQIDLNALADFKDQDDLLRLFVEQCTHALYRLYRPEEESVWPDLSLRGLYRLLLTMNNEMPEGARYMLILDNIERLGRISMDMSDVRGSKKTPQEHGIALLDRCRAIRTIVDLIDEFKKFGFILSIESLPRASVVDQFTHVSADLARFTTKTLQTFAWEDTVECLAQKVSAFRSNDEAAGPHLVGEESLFTRAEQSWLLELAGTHPHLLRQCCYDIFQFKAYKGMELQEGHKSQLLALMREEVSTFLSQTWKRLQEALKKSSNSEEIEKQFYAFISHCSQYRSEDTIEPALWDNLKSELRYILYSEGIVRSDFGPVHFPGLLLGDYLAQQARETHKMFFPPAQNALPPERGYVLAIMRPGYEQQVSLSRLEYRLLKALLQHPDRCTEQQLIFAAWEKDTDRSTFTQRLHKLRKKLQDYLPEDIIINNYGGIYSLSHPEWLELE